MAADPEPVGLIDAAAVALQAVAAVAGLALFRRPTPVARGVVPALPVVALVAVLGVAGGLAGPTAHDHDHEQPAEAPLAAESGPRPDLFGDLFTAHTDGTHDHTSHPEPATSADRDHDHEAAHDHDAPHDH